jgi:hypothetical protein
MPHASSEWIASHWPVYPETAKPRAPLTYGRRYVLFTLMGIAAGSADGAAFTNRLRAMGIRDKPIAPGSSRQNGFAERLIGSIRRDCVDHIVVPSEAHIRRIV